MKNFILIITLLTVYDMADAQNPVFPPAKVSFDDFAKLVTEVEPHRKERLLSLDAFLKMSKEEGVIILDTRSDFRYERKHVKGAKHLAFTDFTQDNLKKLIPDFNTKILIYCNNNFNDDEVDFATKKAVPKINPEIEKSLTPNAPPDFNLFDEENKYDDQTPAIFSIKSDTQRQFRVQEKPIMLALNIPTYINLYGYGYKNIYELAELVSVNDPRIQFEGTVVKKTK